MSKSRKNIVIYADVLERMHFFSKFVNPLSILGYDVHFITAKYSVYRDAKKKNFTVTLLKRILKTEGHNIDVSRSLSVLNKYHTQKDAKKISKQVISNLMILDNQIEIFMFFVWNGTTTIARTINFFAKRKGIDMRFFEISNLGESIFVDTKGINAESYLYKHPELLDNFDVDEEKYKIWLDSYVKQKKLPRQAANKSKVPWQVIYDLKGYICDSVIWEDRRIGINILVARLLNKIKSNKFDVLPLDKEYAFLPLQVSDDAQLKLFSNYTNELLLEEAIKICKSKGIELIVKIHPAESNRKSISKIVQLSKNNSFHIADNNTDTLIAKSQFLIVNNSTVGLEAKIMNKETMVFGEAIYKYFDKTRLKNYILYYLVPADYFGDKEISLDAMKLILERNMLVK